LLIDEHELNQIDGYHFQVKEHKEKMNKIFVPELIYLKFNAVLKNDNNDYFAYELDCKDIYKKYGIKEFNLYYAIAHYSHFDEYDYNEQNYKEKTGTLVKKKQPSELDALFKECKDKTPSSIPSQSLGYVTIIDDDILNLDEKCYEIDENENENENYNVDDDDDMNINPNDNEYPMVTIDNNVLAKYNSAQKTRLKPNVFFTSHQK